MTGTDSTDRPRYTKPMVFRVESAASLINAKPEGGATDSINLKKKVIASVGKSSSKAPKKPEAKTKTKATVKKK